MGKTIVIRFKAPKHRTYEPIKRAAVFGDKRTKRARTRNEQFRKTMKEWNCEHYE